MDWDPPQAWDRLQAFLQGVPKLLPDTPRAILIVSAHWEADPVAIASARQPRLVYDYGGFPPHTYRLTYPALGHPELAGQIHGRLEDAGIDSVLDPAAGWDHGVFVPLKVIWPDAMIPVVSVSLHASLDASFHLALGAALGPLRDDGVLIVGSGFSYHGSNIDPSPTSKAFDVWLRAAVEGDSVGRDRRLRDWTTAPLARLAHPREEHLIPLMVAAGAGGGDPSRLIYSGEILGMHQSAWAFGKVSTDEVIMGNQDERQPISN
jgi:aromatic ring-opening dioxygenase catalytic subunit (LigB family)